MLLLVFMPDWVENLAGFFGSEGTVLVRYAARVIGIWVLAWIALWVVRLIARRIEASVNDQDDAFSSAKEKRGRTISQLVRGVGRGLVLAAAVLLTVNVFMSITPVLAAAGLLGLAVSFGAQSLVKDVITGFFMLVENQFGLGDVIEAAGLSGSVEEISLRVVKLRALNGTLHIIPNGEIKTVSNMTRGWSRAVLEVGIGYDADLDKALAVFRDEAREFSEDPQWKRSLDGPLEVTGIEALQDSSIVIRVLARTIPGDQWSVARGFRLAIKKRLDAEKIDMPFPQRTVHVRFPPPGEDLADAAERVMHGIRRVDSE